MDCVSIISDPSAQTAPAPVPPTFAEARARFERGVHSFMPERGAHPDILADFAMIVGALHNPNGFVTERIDAAETIIGHTLPSHPQARMAREFLLQTARQEGDRASPVVAAMACHVLANHCALDYVIRNGVVGAFKTTIEGMSARERSYFTHDIGTHHPFASAL